MRHLAPALLLLSFSGLAQTWTQLPDFPGSARDDAASFTIGDRIYVGTGMDAGFQLTSDWHAFDMSTGQWAPIASIPTSPRQYCTGFTIADTGYVFGGVDGNGALAELWAYHPEQDTWEQRASIPAEARYACVAVTGFYTNAIVATGMLGSGVPTNEAWKYDAALDTWQALAPVPGPARHRAACFLDGSGLLIAGGADSSFNALADAWSYPIWFETGEWYPRTPLPSPRFSADGSWGTSPIIIGGATGQSADLVQNTAWRYDFSAWPSLPDFPGGPRRGGVAVAGAQTQWTSTVYYGTGSDNITRFSDWWKLDLPVGITEQETEAFFLSPVPADALLTVRTDGSRTWDTWALMGAEGRVLLRGTMWSNSTEIPTGTIAPGVYLLSLSGLHGTATKRFMVLH